MRQRQLKSTQEPSPAEAFLGNYFFRFAQGSEKCFFHLAQGYGEIFPVSRTLKVCCYGKVDVQPGRNPAMADLDRTAVLSQQIGASRT